MATHLIYILFVFAFGASVGSFLNVIIYRLPRQLSIVKPPSRCPHCDTFLAWKDNIPVFGWILLRGRCRYCKAPISPAYPIVEAITGLLFVFYYWMFFLMHAGPAANLAALRPDGPFFVGGFTTLGTDWPMFALYMLLISGLLAASVIDAELFIIPASIPWWLAGIGIVAHGLIDRPNVPGALLLDSAGMALSGGAAIGLAISIVLLQLSIFPISFPEGDLLEVERAELEAQAAAAAEQGNESPEIPPELTPSQVRREITKEMLFLIPPMLLGGISLWLQQHNAAFERAWESAEQMNWLNGTLGAILGALIGAFAVWFTRIAGSYAFGREAMGLGDVHLMFGMGAILGGGAAVVAFFVAPFFGIAAAVYMLVTGTRRQLPYGPYLSLATAFVMLFYSPIAAYMRPGLIGLRSFLIDH